MAKKHIPQRPAKDRFIRSSEFSLTLAIELQSVERAQIIHTVHKKMQTKAGNPAKYSDAFIRGCWWVYDTYKAWQETYFPLVSEESVRVFFFKPLIESGILVKGNFNTNCSRTTWFTINYDRLYELYPFLQASYPNLNKGNPSEQGKVSQVSKGTKPKSLRKQNPTHLGNETQLTQGTLDYNNNNIYNNTLGSTLYSTERSTEKTALTESVKKENGDHDLTEIFKTFENLTGKDFSSDTESVDLITNLLKAGYSVTDLVGVIKCKADEWSDSEKMRPCIRPKTLFRTDRFSEYLETARSKGYVPKPLLSVNLTLFNALSVNDQNYLTDTGCIDADFNIDFLKLRKLDNGSRNPFSLKITHAINLLSEKGDNRFSEYMFIPDSDVNTLRNIGFISENEEEGRSWLNVTDDIYERIILTYGIG